MSARADSKGRRRDAKLTVALSHPSSLFATPTTHVDLFDLSQITAVITLNDGTAFLANFEQRSVGMRTTRTAMPAYADLTIYHTQNGVCFNDSKESSLCDTRLPSHLDTFKDGLERAMRIELG